MSWNPSFWQVQGRKGSKKQKPATFKELLFLRLLTYFLVLSYMLEALVLSDQPNRYMKTA